MNKFVRYMFNIIYIWMKRRIFNTMGSGIISQKKGYFQESVRTALTVAKGILSREKPDSKFFEKAHIHIHVPEVDLVKIDKK